MGATDRSQPMAYGPDLSTEPPVVGLNGPNPRWCVVCGSVFYGRHDCEMTRAMNNAVGFNDLAEVADLESDGANPSSEPVGGEGSVTDES